MLVALLKGKLSRDQENMEDILTSNVFGVMRYLPPEILLLPFLAKASSPDGENPLSVLSQGMETEMCFWPWLGEPDDGCEPDVLVRIARRDGSKIIVLVEAKYRSGKSSEKDEGERPNDQLAREWGNLKRLAENEAAEPVLIYLTAGFCCPKTEIQDSQDELAKKGQGRANICWLSWRHLSPVIEKSTIQILKDLKAMLRHLNLTFFEGFSEVEVPATIEWRFPDRP